MSKYKAGDKLIIEIENISNLNVTTLGAPSQIGFYKLKGFPYLISKEIIESLQKYVPKKQISDRYAYKKGLKDAWEAARKIGCTPSDGGFNRTELKEIFGSGISCHIVKVFEAAEAVAKIKEYEAEKEKIHVGDVVKHKKNENVVLVVTRIYGDGDFSGMKITKTDECGHLFSHYSKRSLATFEKTGQHYDLNEIFKTGCD